MAILQKLIIYISSFLLTMTPGVTFREGVVGQPTSFFPHETANQSERTISNLIYRGLFKYDIYGTLVPDLAESWEISEDGLVYTITLKENQYWDDGSKINSDDLIYTSFKVPSLSGVATDKVDDRTVRYTLPNKFSPFLSLLTDGVMKSQAEENENPLKPISSGQFKIISIKYSGPIVSDVVLYNTNPEQDIRKLVFKYYANEEEVEIGARLGEIDGFTSHTLTNVGSFQNYKFPLQGVYYGLFFNLRNDKFTDIEFRKKLRAALPVEELISGSGIPVQGPISKSVYTRESIKSDHHDRAIPEEVVSQTITIKVPDIERHIQFARRIADLWEEKFNMSVEVEPVPAENFSEQVIKNRDFELILYGQEVGRDPDRYVYWHSTQKDAPNLNITGFEQVRADRALEEGRKAVDYSERVVHYNEFQSVIEEDAPAIFLYHPYINYYVSDYFKGLGDKYTFAMGDRFLDFANWTRTKTN